MYWYTSTLRTNLMAIRIDPNRSLPLFSQIVEGVRLEVAAGRMRPGDRLPSIRDLAVDLRVNPNTVGKAYQELERRGLVEVRRGLGNFLTGVNHGETERRERRLVLESRIDELVSAGLELGFTPDDLQEALAKRIQRKTDSGSPSKSGLKR